MYINGVYEDGPRSGGFRAVCYTPAFKRSVFTTVLRFKLEEFGQRRNNLFTGGRSYRWFGLHRSEAGNLVVTLNNRAYSHEIKGAVVDKNKWAQIACSVNIPAHNILVFLNARRVADIHLPEMFKLEVGNAQDADNNWTFTDYSLGDVFEGWVSELRLYSRSLSAKELAGIQLSSS